MRRFRAFLLASMLTAERLFERQSAIALLDHVLARLRDEFSQAGELLAFDQFKSILAGRTAEASYAQSAAVLGISDTAAAMTAGSRLRKRYRGLLREEVAQTCAAHRETDAELRELFVILGC
ncbi:MAG: hypothetical protein J5I93_10155 [Pirellulaceae bacterium]|nr:hypothetical protein [Pirellulaceae bacterium]